MKYNMKVITQYNNFSQLGGDEDIIYLKEKIDKLLEIEDTEELIKEFTWCAKMSNMYYDEIDPKFKNHCLQEERKRIEL
jgi:hypothetical protein